MSTASTASPSTSASPADVVALQYGNRYRMVGTPLIILGAVVVVSIIAEVAILRAGGDLTDADYNSGVVWGLAGYMVAVGVQNVSSSFPFALALGSTRRAFVLGNLLTSFAQSALLALVLLVLLGLESLTRGWFIGGAVVAVNTLGGGNPLLLVVVVVLGMLVALSVGAVFGAAWIRYGARGPTAIALGTAAIVVLALLIAAPSLTAIAAAFEPWWLAVLAAALIVASTIGEFLLLRRASVR